MQISAKHSVKEVKSEPQGRLPEASVVRSNTRTSEVAGSIRDVTGSTTGSETIDETVTKGTVWSAGAIAPEPEDTTAVLERVSGRKIDSSSTVAVSRWRTSERASTSASK